MSRVSLRKQTSIMFVEQLMCRGKVLSDCSDGLWKDERLDERLKDGCPIKKNRESQGEPSRRVGKKRAEPEESGQLPVYDRATRAPWQSKRLLFA